MTCTTEGCAAESELFLCAGCVRDLQAWLTKGRELLPDLDVTIHRQDVVRTHSEGGGGGKSGSAAPLNLDALQLKTNLASIDRDANEYAKDPFAAGMAKLVREWVERAEEVILGVAEYWAGTCTCGEPVISQTETATCNTCGANNRAATLRAYKARKVGSELLDAGQLSAWLKAYLGKDVTENQIYKWAHRGLIPQAQAKPPRYDPLAVAIAKGFDS